MISLVILVSALSLAIGSSEVDVDFRNISSGVIISDAGSYFDQPYCSVVNGTFACVITTSLTGEGGNGEHVVSSVSYDLGQTWTALSNVEPSLDSKPSSYAVNIYAPELGRLYAIYGDNWEGIPSPNPKIGTRTDELGVSFWMRYSTDLGLTWSTDLYPVPFPTTAIDRANYWNGRVKMFWCVDQPIVLNGVVYFAFTKIGTYIQSPPEEVYILSSPNLLTESDPNQVIWQTLPDADHGLMATPYESTVLEEPHVVHVVNNTLWVVGRTQLGFLPSSYSYNGGQNWTAVLPAVYSPSTGQQLRNPRGPIAPWKFSNGLYLMLFYNNANTNDGAYGNRNPYWLTAGRQVGNIIEWSQPEIALYDGYTVDGRPGYPCLFEHNGSVWFTETQKTIARIHRLPDDWLANLWNQWDISGVPTDGLVVDVAVNGSNQVPLPKLPLLSFGQATSIAFWLELNSSVAANQVLFSNRASYADDGFTVSVVNDNMLGIQIRSNQQFTHNLTTDSFCGAYLFDGNPHHVSFVIDGAPKVSSVVVDDVLCDGGKQFPQGWRFFVPQLASLNGDQPVLQIVDPFFGGRLKVIRIYDRYLMTSESIGMWRAGV